MGRNAIIPGIDPEVTVHGDMPMLAEPDTPRGFSAHDLRADRERFADLANPVIDAFPARLSGPWWRFNAVACSIPNAIVRNRLIFHDGLPVVGVGNLRWEMKAAEVAHRGVLQLEQPEQYFPGRTGLLIGRSSFNYYHFISDVLVFMEDLRANLDLASLDRIVINPCRDVSDSFQHQLIEVLYPELAEKVVMNEMTFQAEHLTFVNVWPRHFEHGEGDQALRVNGMKGVSRRAYRSSTLPFFKRAEQMIGRRTPDEQSEVVIISRKAASGRKVTNEDQLAEALAPLGAQQVVMEHLSVREQLDLSARARVLIGAHGAGMTNAGFCQSGATCLELTGRHYLQRAPDFATFAMVRDIEYQFIVADEDGDITQMRGNRGNDIHLGRPALDHIVETVDRALATRSHPSKA